MKLKVTVTKVVFLRLLEIPDGLQKWKGRGRSRKYYKERCIYRNAKKKDMRDIRYLPGMERKVRRDRQIPTDDMGRRTEPGGTGKSVITGRNSNGFCRVLRCLQPVRGGCP